MLDVKIEDFWRGVWFSEDWREFLEMGVALRGLAGIWRGKLSFKD